MNGHERSDIVERWKQLYQAALFEADPKHILERIMDAEQAIGERALTLLGMNDDTNSEKETLANAHTVLDDLKRIYRSNRAA